MSGSRRKATVRHDLWNKLRDIGGLDIEIMRDPLHRRYEVNRHGLQANVEKDAEAVYERLLTMIKADGWETELGVSSAIYARHPIYSDVTAILYRPEELHSGESRLRITIS